MANCGKKAHLQVRPKIRISTCTTSHIGHNVNKALNLSDTDIKVRNSSAYLKIPGLFRRPSRRGWVSRHGKGSVSRELMAYWRKFKSCVGRLTVAVKQPHVLCVGHRAHFLVSSYEGWLWSNLSTRNTTVHAVFISVQPPILRWGNASMLVKITALFLYIWTVIIPSLTALRINWKKRLPSVSSVAI